MVGAGESARAAGRTDLVLQRIPIGALPLRLGDLRVTVQGADGDLRPEKPVVEFAAGDREAGLAVIASPPGQDAAAGVVDLRSTDVNRQAGSASGGR